MVPYVNSQSLAVIFILITNGQSGTQGYGGGGVANQPYSAAGAGTGIGHGLGHGGQQQPKVPPTGTLNDPNQSRGSTGQRITGKMESAVGSAVGSETLKAKGFQKEQ